MGLYPLGLQEVFAQALQPTTEGAYVPGNVPYGCYIMQGTSTVYVPCTTSGASFIPSASGSGGGGALTNPVGAANALPAQVSMSTTAGLIAAARTGAAGTGRVAITILEPVTCGTLYVGPTNGVTPTTGFPITAGASLTLNTTSALYGILASGSCAITAELETY
jgi:hypothetical protein